MQNGSQFNLADIEYASARLMSLNREFLLPEHRITLLTVRGYAMPQGWKMRLHEHSYYEANVILEGGAIAHGDTDLPLGPGQIYYHAPNTPHAWSTPNMPCLRMILGFDVTPSIPVPPSAQTATCPDLLLDVAMLINATRERRALWRNLAGSRLTAILGRIISLGDDREDAADSVDQQLDFLSTVDRFLADNQQHPIQLEDVAKHVGVSLSGLSHRYRDLTGNSIGHRLTSLRLAQAADLLLTTTCSLGEIADASGIGDAAYLCRLFKRYFGKTPTQYRQGAERGLLFRNSADE